MTRCTLLHLVPLCGLAALGLAPNATGTARAAEIVLMADLWCPYNCDPGSDHPGYAVELARAAFAGSGHGVTYRALSWSRSLAEVKAGRGDALIGLTTREEPEFVFPHESIGSSALGFAVRAESGFRLGSVASLKGHALGVVASYTYNGPFGEYLRLHQADRDLVQPMSGEHPLETNLSKLQAGRIDVVADDVNVLAQAVGDLGLGERIRVESGGQAETVYIAFSPVLASAPMLARMFDEGIARLRRSGELAGILARYHLRDWK